MRIKTLFALTVISICLFSGCHNPQGGTEILKVDNPEINHSSWQFLYEHWKEKKLAELKNREKLSELMEGTEDEFSLFVNAMSWTNQQWEHSIPDPYPLSNALSILDDIRSGKTGGFCGQYAYVLGDVLKALGFYAVRYVELVAPDGKSHFVVEAWSNQYVKWIILDPDYNIYYTDMTGIPLNALELHNAFVEDKTDRVKVVKVQPQPPKLSIDNCENNCLPRYDSFAVSLRSDLMRHTKPLTTQDRYDMFLAWNGKRISKKKMKYRQASNRKEDLYFTVNAIKLTPEALPDGSIKVRFDEIWTTPNYKTTLVKEDGGPWKQSKTEFIWKPGKGTHVLEAATVNENGILGVRSTLMVKVK